MGIAAHCYSLHNELTTPKKEIESNAWKILTQVNLEHKGQGLLGKKEDSKNKYGNVPPMKTRIMQSLVLKDEEGTRSERPFTLGITTS